MLWFKGAFLPSAFIIFCTLITSIRCDSFSNAIEGGSVQLDFAYPCNRTKITLHYGNRLPFYSLTNPDIQELNPDQSERFTVENTNEEGNCFLRMSIDPVKRLDGGTYILLTYNGDYITRIGLHVDLLPGVAHCSFGRSHDYAGDWERLHCEAIVGSMFGQIQCYQDGMRMPHFVNDKTLKQTILVRKNRHHVYCCSSQLIEPKERCDCDDSVWDPLSKGKVHNPGNPCPTTTHVPNMSLTNSNDHNGTSSTVRAIIPIKDEIREYSYHVLIIYLIVIFLFVLMSMTACCAIAYGHA